MQQCVPTTTGTYCSAASHRSTGGLILTCAHQPMRAECPMVVGSLAVINCTHPPTSESWSMRVSLESR
jgi:hypothetical protein